jgi:hypothetical protein
VPVFNKFFSMMRDGWRYFALGQAHLPFAGQVYGGQQAAGDQAEHLAEGVEYMFTVQVQVVRGHDVDGQLWGCTHPDTDGPGSVFEIHPAIHHSPRPYARAGELQLEMAERGVLFRSLFLSLGAIPLKNLGARLHVGWCYSRRRRRRLPKALCAGAGLLGQGQQIASLVQNVFELQQQQVKVAGLDSTALSRLARATLGWRAGDRVGRGLVHG